VAVLGDGDFLMGGTAAWTAAHYQLPLLIVVANNSFFYNDVVHQERVAARRQRPAGNSWIGQAINDPEPDLGAFARSLGFQAGDQVRDRSALPAVLTAAAAAARSGQCVLVDVRVRPDGYGALGGGPQGHEPQRPVLHGRTGRAGSGCRPWRPSDPPAARFRRDCPEKRRSPAGISPRAGYTYLCR
jgi:thiamine pyrophosphate-dependent acetolactate synthase large subunit-like protein